MTVYFANSQNVAPSGIVTHSSYIADKVGGTDGDLITGNTATDSEENPWWQVQLPSVMAIELVLVYNIRGSCAKRLFHYVNCDAANPTGYFNGANQGAVIGVSSEPCSGDSCSGIQCGEIRQNEQSQVYKVSCGGASGTYVYVMLPGSMRRVNLNEVQVWTGPLPGSASPYYLLQANTCCCPARSTFQYAGQQHYHSFRYLPCVQVRCRSDVDRMAEHIPGMFGNGKQLHLFGFELKQLDGGIAHATGSTDSTDVLGFELKQLDGGIAHATGSTDSTDVLGQKEGSVDVDELLQRRDVGASMIRRRRRCRLLLLSLLLLILRLLWLLLLLLQLLLL
ncbi:hypothetical protein CYMTET_31884 [Cymbomonas tetramitiformis]|uniref:Fucolectin tachylectin-4 pentraxin-1 domain-containing protein n=1 Tax=Cymbomonas tetramitiformis TaxID=36881 RepID=A0AAE0FFZ5_9CHLO|nr:hypothetical protein CYMTET_31884 [Cymbomonas tetramitiformis]